MNRRAAVERITLLLGGGALSPQLTAGLMGQVINVGASVTVTPAQEALLAEVADVIIPTTDTPGAQAAGKKAVLEKTVKDNKAFFKLMRELSITGYFTSEIGATQALAYLPIPGQFLGDVPLKPGQKAWAISG